MWLILQVEWILTELFNSLLNPLESNVLILLQKHLLCLLPSPVCAQSGQGHASAHPWLWKPANFSSHCSWLWYGGQWGQWSKMTQHRGVWGQGPPSYGDWTEPNRVEIRQPICPGAMLDCGGLISQGVTHPVQCPLPNIDFSRCCPPSRWLSHEYFSPKVAGGLLTAARWDLIQGRTSSLACQV